jgi:hypothetical protein
MNCEQIVMASFMHADWSSCWPAAAGSGASATQSNSGAGAKLILIKPIFITPPTLDETRIKKMKTFAQLHLGQLRVSQGL